MYRWRNAALTIQRCLRKFSKRNITKSMTPEDVNRVMYGCFTQPREQGQEHQEGLEVHDKHDDGQSGERKAKSAIEGSHSEIQSVGLGY